MQRSHVSDHFRRLPAFLRRILRESYWNFHRERVRRRILDYYCSREKTDDEAAVIAYLRENPLHVFPYEFVKKYSPQDIVVEYDARKGLPYSTYHGRRLYYPPDMPDDEIRTSLLNQLIEQDPASPHRYLTRGCSPAIGDVVADIGAAEGTFSLDVVEGARKVYLFEPEARWHLPLRATFEPWSEKVVIIPAVVSDTDSNGCISLDRYFTGKESEVHFLKVDAEGAERKVMTGARGLLTRGHHQKGVICTYHRQDDGQEIRKQLQGLGFSTYFSTGYMIYYWDKQISGPYLRPCLIRFTQYAEV
jgi:hypothetical protein